MVSSHSTQRPSTPRHIGAVAGQSASAAQAGLHSERSHMGRAGSVQSWSSSHSTHLFGSTELPQRRRTPLATQS